MKTVLEPIVYASRTFDEDAVPGEDPYVASMTVSVNDRGVANLVGLRAEDFTVAVRKSVRLALASIGVKKVIYTKVRVEVVDGVRIVRKIELDFDVPSLSELTAEKGADA